MKTKEVTLFPAQYEAINFTTQFAAAVAGVQSGKTFLGTHWAGKKITELPDKDGIIVAPTYKILNAATLRKFFDTFPELRQYYKEQKGEIKLPTGGTVYIRSADNPLTIEGITAHWVWLDEGGMASQLTWTVLRSRVSMTGGQILITTTPYSMNWLYKDFFLPWQDGKDKSLSFYTWASVDNPSFSKEYYEGERRRLTPEEFSRRYMGEFRKMSGLVFDIPEDQIIDPIHDIATKADVRLMGVDWGFRNPAALSVIAYYDKTYYIIDEWKQAERTTEEIAVAASNFVKDYRVEKIYPDPAEPDRLQEFRNKHLPVYEANKSVEDGINQIRQLIKEKKLFIFKTCVQTLEEMSMYRYDESADDKEVKEKPIKLNDHLCDALRYAIYSFQPLDSKQPEASPPYVPDYLSDLGIFKKEQPSARTVSQDRFASQEGYKEPVKASEPLSTQDLYDYQL